MQQPTLSPQSNRLIEVCNALMEGKAGNDDLSSILEEMYDGIEKAKEDFLQEANKQGEKYVEQIKFEMEKVLECFENYQESMDEIGAYLEDGDKSHLKTGVEMVVEATGHLLDGLALYESKSLQIGPTSFPVLNMLILLSQGFNRGDIPETEYRAMIQNAIKYFSLNVKELEEYKGDQAKSAVKVLLDGFTKFVDGLKRIDEFAQSHDESAINEALEYIHESQKTIQEGYDKYYDEIFLDGPTESPYANQLISIIDGHKKGIFNNEILAEHVGIYEEEVTRTKNELEEILSQPYQSEDIDSELPRTEDSFDMLDDAVDDVKTYLEDNDKTHLDEAIRKLIEGTANLKKSQTAFEAIGEKEGKISCIHCGAYNDFGVKVCGKCGAILPQMAGIEQSTFQLGESGQMASSATGQVVMTENLKKIVDATEALYEEEISFDEFEATLDWMEDNLRNSEGKVGAMSMKINTDAMSEAEVEAAEKLQTIMEDTLELMREGINDFYDGINTLRSYGDNPDPEILKNGIETCTRASAKIYEVEQVSDSLSKQIDELMQSAGSESSDDAGADTDGVAGNAEEDYVG